ncbi:MAG: hypothetical protein U9R23_04725 [Candidatus Cloacimonadota bacterium]|nr:hypothetical protein [Candidatus Cloacimonadota bacterium]
MQDIGIIACYEDNRVQEDMFKDYFSKFYNIQLHPIQFDELCAKVTYKNLLLNRIPKYITILPETKNDVVNVLSPSVQGYSKSPIYDKWDQYTYAKILFSYWDKYGLTFEDVYKEPEMVLSFISNENNSLKKLDAEMNLINSD